MRGRAGGAENTGAPGEARTALDTDRNAELGPEVGPETGGRRAEPRLHYGPSDPTAGPETAAGPHFPINGLSLGPNVEGSQVKVA